MVISKNIMVNKCVVGCRSSYHGKYIVTAFSFPKNYEDHKIKRIIFVKDWEPSLPLFTVYISHFEDKYFKKRQKSQESSMNELVKTCSEYLPK